MKIDVETFDCLGTPIVATFTRKGAFLSYRNAHHEDGEPKPERHRKSVKERLDSADFYRRNPREHIDILMGEADDMSEWAFVMEQLAAEGFFKAEKL